MELTKILGLRCLVNVHQANRTIDMNYKKNISEGANKRSTTTDRSVINYCTVKKMRRFYGKIPGNQLPVHIPLFLRASACRTFLEIKKW